MGAVAFAVVAVFGVMRRGIGFVPDIAVFIAGGIFVPGFFINGSHCIAGGVIAEDEIAVFS